MEDVEKSNPYAYLERKEFTSELFKIEIKNLHRQAGFGQIKKKLSALGVKPHKVKIVGSITFVTFKTAVDRDFAITKLQGHVWKGNELAVKIAKGRADPCMQKRQADQDDQEFDQNSKKTKIEPDVDPEEKLRDMVTKLWRQPYAHQLHEKHKTTKNILCQLYYKLLKDNPILSSYLKPVELEKGQMACELLNIVPSPVETCYRNKCEFTIGVDLAGKGPVVGFRYGKYRGGVNAVGPPYSARLMPEAMDTAVRHVQTLLTKASGAGWVSGLRPLTAYNMEDMSGHWRSATVRVNRAAEVMLMLDMHPQDLTTDEFQKLEDAMVMFFSVGEGKDANLSSLYLAKRSKSADAFDSSTTKHLYGQTFICETLNGIKFQISYNSFFQINTLAAELLYLGIGEVCDLSKSTILLDVCSGTGTIGLALANLVDKVIGVEICEDAVKDARKNAEANGITNTEFLAGSAQDLIPSVLIDIPQDRSVVAIVDPPRAGLHSSVIVALRRCPQLKTLVYVSCNPSGAFSNLLDLGRPESNRLRGDPIVPVRAIDFDLFPQTNHVELVMLMKRIEKPSPVTSVTMVSAEPSQDTAVSMVSAEPSLDAAVSMVSAEPSQNTAVSMVSAEPSLDAAVSMVSAEPSLDAAVSMVSAEPSQDTAVSMVSAEPSLDAAVSMVSAEPSLEAIDD